MILSIIIPTYKRKDSLLRLLESLKKEITSGQEIIVVEQVVDNQKEILAYGEKEHLPLQYVLLKKASTSHAKNVGVEKAKGRYIVFFDDDVVIHPGIFKVYLENFQKKNYKKIGGIAGRVITPGQPYKIDSVKVGKVSFWGNFSDNFSSNIPQEVDTVIGCNAAWKRDVLVQVGGFDEQFDGNAMREESDLSLRVKALGYTIIFDPHAIVTHLREETGGSRKTEGRMYWYFHFFSNEVYFLLKHRPILILPVILVTRGEWILRCMLGFGREVSVRSFITPFLGMYDGFKKYRRFRESKKNI